MIGPGTLTKVRNSAGFTATLTGYATDRELTQAVFVFAAAAGSNLQTTTLTVPAADPGFPGYFAGSSSVPFGSQFTYTQAHGDRQHAGDRFGDRDPGESARPVDSGDGYAELATQGD